MKEMIREEFDEELYNVVPHLDRERKSILRNMRPNESRNCYISCDVAKAIMNHAFQYDRRRFYHWTKPFGSPKYILIFKRRHMMQTFEQVDRTNHKFLGRSPWGIVIDGIIEITWEAGETNLLAGNWRWIKQLS
ncbi:hypothetical protein ACHAWO_001342 [Cyclotella atomus]|uniref:Uncharacterized protein n=1 Tax=Cyclotella atomus TaxID=382360 RepID=A0ABD3PR25_9STRA